LAATAESRLESRSHKLSWTGCLYVVIPAEAGIQWLSGCRIMSGMTVLFLDDKGMLNLEL
jgi:hypothetical protein